MYRHREWVRNAPLGQVIKMHQVHAQASAGAGLSTQQEVFFVREGELLTVETCVSGKCSWCDSAVARFKREENQYYRRISAATSRAG